MKKQAILLFAFVLSISVNAQKFKAKPKNWSVFNREVSFAKNVMHLDAKPNKGILWLNDVDFGNGIIEFDIKGENTPGKSFVGLAFHGVNDSTYDVVYFRSFNFKNPKRKSNAIQYISEPEYHWYTLRKEFPGKYESNILPIPKPVDGWFHVKIEINHQQIKVFVNDSEKTTLAIEQLSNRGSGKIGFWVGNGSEGWFRNLELKMD